MTVKTSRMLQSISISNRYCSFELSIHQSILHNVQTNIKQQHNCFQHW